VNRQSGFSTIAMVMMLLALGSVLLHGLEQYLRTQSSLLMNERGAIIAFNNALSAQAWGTTLRWQPAKEWQCKTYQSAGLRACVRSLPDAEVLLAAQGLADNQTLTLWRWGTMEASLTFSSHGWIDSCPLSEAALCKLP